MKSSTFVSFVLASHAYASFVRPTQRPILESPSSSISSLLKLHKELVQHESISGNEHNVAQYLIKYLKSQNFTVETQDVGPQESSGPPRQNILAYVGAQRKTRVLVSSHIDTVPPFWPYERRGDQIWGRGSVDAKGSVATQIIATEELLAAGKIHDGDVALLYVVGEEVGGDGMKKANDLGLKWESAIFGEPTELKLASGHKGIVSYDIKAKGKAGHSGYPELGKSATAMLIPALNALLNAEFPSSKKYGNTTVNIGKMEGGVAANVIAQDASAKVAMRIADGGPDAITDIVVEAVKSFDPEIEVTVPGGGGYGPVFIDSDVPGELISFVRCS
jgi:acetylornithine deacetylase